MTCNAFNHPANCDCGWGGAFYSSADRLVNDFQHWREASSYTTPNATCPICGSKVFFYKSPYGGSVYFDGLGPPWPKHPCTDRARIPASEKFPVAQRPGGEWRPFFCTAIHRHANQPEIVVLVAVGPQSNVELYARTDPHALETRAPFLVRHDKQQKRYKISTLRARELQPDVVEFFAYSSPPRSPTEEANASVGKSATSNSPALFNRQKRLPPPIQAVRVLIDPSVTHPAKRTRVDPASVPVVYKKKRAFAGKRIVGTATQPEQEEIMKSGARETSPATNSVDRVRIATAMEFAFNQAQRRFTNEKS